MSTVVVQERHLWLNLVEMKDVDKAHFLDAQAGLFGGTVEGFAQQFSAVQQQIEAIQHTCPGVMHHPPLPPGPGLSLPVAVGALLCPPELLRPRPNRYLGRRVEPLPGVMRATRRCWNLLFLRIFAPSPGGGPGGESSVSVPPLVQGPVLFGTQGVRWGCLRTHRLLYHPPLLPFAAPPQVCRLCRWSCLHSVWRRGSRCPACLAGSCAQFDSATRFSSPGDLPSSMAFSRRRWQSGTPVLREEIAVLLANDAIEPVPPAERRQGFYSPYFIVPKKRGGLRPILDLRVLNRALHKLPFKMRMRRRIIKCIQPQDWFAAIDLKDAYFHVSILLRHRPFLRFAFEGRAWQYRVLPFRLSLSPHVFTKVVEGTLTPLREVGVRILNYLDDWLILAQSREQLGDHRDLVLRHLSQLGLRVNWEKSKLSPVQRISFLGVELDSVSMTARLTEERAQAVLNCLSSFSGRNVVPLKQFQRLLRHMASAAAVTPLGLLHMLLLNYDWDDW